MPKHNVRFIFERTIPLNVSQCISQSQHPRVHACALSCCYFKFKTISVCGSMAKRHPRTPPWWGCCCRCWSRMSGGVCGLFSLLRLSDGALLMRWSAKISLSDMSVHLALCNEGVMQRPSGTEAAHQQMILCFRRGLNGFCLPVCSRLMVMSHTVCVYFLLFSPWHCMDWSYE